MFHNSLMPGDRVNGFNHARIGVAKEISDLCRGKIGFFELGAKGGAPVMIVIKFIYNYRFCGLTVDMLSVMLR